jgi:hemolysin activation/secretion protein
MPLSIPLRRLSLTAALLGASVAAWAQPQPPKPQQPPQAQPQQQRQPHRDQQALSESVRRAERNGQVLSAEQVQSDGRDVNRVKIIDDRGRVRVFWDDPATKPQNGKKRGSGEKGRQDSPRTRSDDDGDPTL